MARHSELSPIDLDRQRARWVPTRGLVWAAIVPAVAAVAVAIVPTLWKLVVGLDAGLVLLCLLDWWRTPRGAIELTREVADVLAVGQPNPVVLRLKNRSARTLSIEVIDDLFEGATWDGLPGRLDLRPYGQATLRYQVRPGKRGAYELGDHFVRYTCAGALLTRQERIAASDSVHVYPDVLSVRQYDVWARQGLERLPGSARMRGGESEFERLRQYTRDDEYRHIDWRATARRRSLTVRQFQTETQQSMLLMIDCGRAMRAESAGLSFLDHALNASLMLAHVALERGDQVGMVAFDSEPKAFVPPGSGGATERKLIQAVYDLEPRLAEPDYPQVFSFLKTRVRRRTLIVLFTQVLDPGAASRLSILVRGLMPRHLPLCVLLRDRDVDQLSLGPVTDPRELYVRGAAAEAILWRDQLVRDLKGAGVLVIDVYPDQMTPAVVKRYAEVKARRLL